MKVFISYTQQDKNHAELIADRLRQAGHDVWQEFNRRADFYEKNIIITAS